MITTTYEILSVNELPDRDLRVRISRRRVVRFLWWTLRETYSTADLLTHHLGLVWRYDHTYDRVPYELERFFSELLARFLLRERMNP